MSLMKSVVKNNRPKFINGQLATDEFYNIL